MTVKQYTKLYFITVIVFVMIATWQQIKMASLHELSKQASAQVTTGVMLKKPAEIQAHQDSLHNTIYRMSGTIEQYKTALEAMKKTHPEAAKHFDHIRK